jgi:acetyl esterase
MPLHAQAKRFLEMLAAREVPTWAELGPTAARDVFVEMRSMFGGGPSVNHVSDQRIADRFDVRVYRPHGDGKRPVVLYFHGGGWVLGDLETHDPLCRRLATESDCVVVAVDYRRAPEDTYPAAFEDCYEATCFVHDHADELGVDPDRLAIAGDSAGGNLAAAVALKARDTNGPRVRLQVLIYPVIEPHFESSSYLQFADGYGLTRDSMMWFWEQYLVDQPVDPYVAPSRAATFENLPPAHVVVAEFDVLRTEGEAFADQLHAAGVPVTRRVYDGMIHGFVHLSGVFDVGRQAVSDVASLLKEQLQIG